ncbi:DUF3081 domain-containing protein [Flocculibacter collagenilyticus]|uniref:DUF3081 domain-containing protein n=1 Tax=Flocculibacter collagenilyticus TaxID=2744479 RepID=UPI0018F713E3|nr:DUF3081 domain-containing protein [Flocculibacter collagenilyticus]
MQNPIDVQQVLRVFDKVTQRGERKEGSYYLDGITATQAEDGYTITLSDANVTLSLFFHNKYNFDYADNAAFDRFIKRVKHIDKEY